MATFRLLPKNKKGQRLDLRKITEFCKNAEYNPDRFRAVMMRFREPKATGILFATGKVTVIGVRKVKDANLVAKLIEKAVIKVIEMSLLTKDTSDWEG